MDGQASDPKLETTAPGLAYLNEVTIKLGHPFYVDFGEVELLEIFI